MHGLPNNPYGISGDYAETADGRTQTDATLALAFEQRTANLIAFYGIAISIGARDKPTDDLQRQIVERLGLKEEGS